jgi:hypothetical protein
LFLQSDLYILQQKQRKYSSKYNLNRLLETSLFIKINSDRKSISFEPINKILVFFFQNSKFTIQI